MSSVTAVSLLVQMKKTSLLIQNMGLVWYYLEKVAQSWYQHKIVRSSWNVSVLYLDKNQLSLSCDDDTAGAESVTLESDTQQLLRLDSFESGGQGNLHPKDFKQPVLILIFCKSGNTGGTSISAFYLSSSFESVMQPFQPWLQNSCPNLVTGTPELQGCDKNSMRQSKSVSLIATHSKRTDERYWVMHNWRRTGLISVRIGWY